MPSRGAHALAILTLVSGGWSFSGCGSSISGQLQEARTRVDEAQGGIAARVNPDEVRRAERTLERAEAASDGSPEEIDLAYIADRQARLAMVNARAAQTTEVLERSQRDYRRELERAVMTRHDQLRQRAQRVHELRAELARIQEMLNERGQVLDARTRELRERESELSARIDELIEARQEQAAAEQRAASAMEQLREIANVQQDQEDVVITLTGEVLFHRGQSTLRYTAVRSLRAVAQALAERPDTDITIEGHTDSRGTAEYNLRLSEARANEVRSFLETEGISRDRMRVVARGELEPIADNTTPDGRANNRRVEIILTPRRPRP